MATLTIRDETTTGAISEPFTLDFLTEHITVRELIRERVYQEVGDHNANQADTFRGLVQPTDAERTLNGFKVPRGRMIDWEPQYRKACEAFEQNGILVLVGDRQTRSLDEIITITPSTEVSFLKLVPLVGG
ncbi:MAG: hypothetical protein KDA28_03340 [Phycisphaerales bacterium]|nr:hypothetical protein [Phycisphaerales bacterium]